VLLKLVGYRPKGKEKIMNIQQKNESVNEWEAELDMLGTSSETEKYLHMLQKAPAYAPSLPTLTNFIQKRMSA